MGFRNQCRANIRGVGAGVKYRVNYPAHANFNQGPDPSHEMIYESNIRKMEDVENCYRLLGGVSKGYNISVYRGKWDR